VSTTSRRYHTKIFLVEQTHQSNWILQEIHKQLQKYQGQQEINYAVHKDLDQALTCCVKMVQQISYAKEMRNLMEKQEFAARSSLKTLHPFIDKEGLLRVGGRLQQSTLPYQTMHQMILLSNHHFTHLQSM